METQTKKSDLLNIRFKTKADGLRYNLTDMATAYLAFLLENKEIHQKVWKEENFSVIQYANVEVLKTFVSIAVDVYNALARMPRHTGLTFLNVGMGAGFLERIVKLHEKIDLKSVEWEEQDDLFKPLRHHLEVETDYICNSIFDDFEIYQCDEKFSYVLLIRFFPLNKRFSNLEEVKELLTKFKKYSDKAIIIDYYGNYTDKVIDFFNSIQSERLPLKKEFDHFILDLDKV